MLEDTRISRVIAFSFATMIMQCSCSTNDESYKDKTSLAKGDTVNITKYTIDRRDTLNSKQWHVFNVDNDVVCLPVSWHYHNTDSVLFSASTVHLGSSLVIKRYSIDDIPDSIDEVASVINSKSFPGFSSVKSGDLNKSIYESGTIYEAYSIRKKAESLYDQHLILFVNGKYFYQVELSLNKNEYNSTMSKNILHNLKINQNYLYLNTNKLKRVVIMKK